MKINKYKKISLLALSMIFATSCSESFLEDVSSTDIELTDTSIRTRADVDASVKGLYALMRNSNGIAASHMNYQELTADIAFVSSSNSGYFVETNGGTHITPDGVTGSMWNAFYSIISQTNFVLSFEGKITDDGAGLQSLPKLFAHAKAIRALNYYTLLTYYSPNYGEGDQKLGVPYPTTYDITAKLPRVTVQQAVDNIITDLTSAIEADPGKLAAGDQNNTLGTTAIKLLLARVYLYKKDYPKAQEYAQQVLDDPTSKLLPRLNSPGVDGVSNYFTLEGESSPETLYQIQLDALHNNGNNGLTGHWGTGSTYAQNFMAKAFFDSFPVSDKRRDGTSWYRYAGTVVNGPEYANDTPRPVNIVKYANLDRDVVVLRKTEAIFIKAEAQYHSNPTAAGTTLRDWVRGYRQTSYNLPAGVDILDEILRQKGFEFFLEGLRFSDLKRNNKPIVKKQTSLNMTIPVGDRRFIWPVPLSEMQTNPNMVQAPGYN